MVDIDLLFAGGKPKAKTGVYLKWDRSSALADYIVRHAGTIEVPISFQVPNVELLKDTMPKYPRSHEEYYTDGGLHWPDRVVITAA